MAATAGIRSTSSNSGVPQMVVPIMLWMKRSSLAKMMPAQPARLACRMVTGVASPSTSAIWPRALANCPPSTTTMSAARPSGPVDCAKECVTHRKSHASGNAIHKAAFLG